jgi:hypothetical protein
MKCNLLLTLAFLVLTSSLGFAQEKPCLLDIKGSPTVRGIKLGMKKAEVEAYTGSELYGRENFNLLNPREETRFLLNAGDIAAKKVLNFYKQKEVLTSSTKDYLKVPNGSRNVNFSPQSNAQSNTEKFKDVHTIFFEFFDDRLYFFKIYYDTDAYKDATEQEFYKEIAPLLGMHNGFLSNNGEATCNNFSLNAKKVTSSLISISLTDFVTEKSLREKAIQTVREMYEKFKKENVIDRGFKP